MHRHKLIKYWDPPHKTGLLDLREEGGSESGVALFLTFQFITLYLPEEGIMRRGLEDWKVCGWRGLGNPGFSFSLGGGGTNWDFSASGMVFVALTFAGPWRTCYLGVVALLTSGRQYQLQRVTINI